ncbi:MAG: ABC transporter substrate-binding protein [Bacillota bacterium]
MLKKLLKTGFMGLLAVALILSFSVNTVQADVVEIDYYYGLGGYLGEVMEEMIAEFNEANSDVQVRGITYGDFDEALQSFQAGVAAGDPPAAVMLEPTPTVEFASRGILASVSDLIAADDQTDADDYYDAFYDMSMIDGEQYAIPLFGTTQVLYYRHDLFEEEGISPEKLETWEGMEEAATKLAARDDVEYGWMPMWGRYNMMDAAFARGGKMISDDGTEVLIDSEEWVETWEAFRKWIHEDEIMGIHHSGVGWEYWYDTIDDVLEGNAAGYTGSSGDQGDLDFDIVSAAIQPGWEGHGDPAPVGEARYGVIPANISEEKKEAAYRWFAFFSSPEKTAEWNMKTGYLAVRNSALDIPEFAEFLEENPNARVPLDQLDVASPYFIDPTGGDIEQALDDAADAVQIENVPAEEALGEAKERAQRALDQTN